jgi:hypothetical protein
MIWLAASIRSFVMDPFWIWGVLGLIARLKLCAAAALNVINTAKGTYSTVQCHQQGLYYRQPHAILYRTNSNWLFHFLVIITYLLFLIGGWSYVPSVPFSTSESTSMDMFYDRVLDGSTPVLKICLHREHRASRIRVAKPVAVRWKGDENGRWSIFPIIFLP